MTIGHAAIDRGLLDGARLSAAFARSLGRADASDVAGPANLLGLEHEFTVHDTAGVRVDFRSLIHDLNIDGARLDPADPNAYRCRWGGVFTVDGREAELATPPVVRGPGFGVNLAEWAALGRAELERLLPAGVELRGYSTHISAAMPDYLTAAAARLYAERFGPALMMLLDGPASPGLLVRPRPGRLELGGEFVDGPRLAAVAAFVAGSARLCGLAAGGDRRARRHLPSRVRFSIAPAWARYGWFIDRSAFGFDLYAEGRDALLRRRFLGRVSGHAFLEAAWAAARNYVSDLTPSELDLLERLVDGRARLPIEGADGDDPTFVAPASTRLRSTLPPPEGRLLAARRRPGFSVRPALATWDFALFAVSARGRTAYASVPRPVLGDFLTKLDRGALDGLLRAYLARPAAGRLLASAQDASRPGLHDAHVSPRSLLPAERRPRVPGEVGDRPGKQEQPPAEAGLAPLTRARRSPGAGRVPRSLVLGGALATCLVLGAVLLVVAGVLPLGPPQPTSTPSVASLATAEPTVAVTATVTATVTAAAAPPTPLAPTPTDGSAISPEDLTGLWSFEASNPRVIAATGAYAGGTVVLDGSRYIFMAGDAAGNYHALEGPLEFHGILELACRPTHCTFEGLPLHQLHAVGDQLQIVHAATLNPLGTFGDSCDWVDVPQGGVLSVEPTGTAGSEEMVAAFTFAAGEAAGLGEACDLGFVVMAWDVTATRLP